MRKRLKYHRSQEDKRTKNLFFFVTLMDFLKDKNYRSLLITTLIYIASGSLVYHYVEGWSYLDCLYFSVVTLTTVGFGDITPQTDAGKAFTIFYIMVGVGVILSFVNIVYKHYFDRNDVHS